MVRGTLEQGKDKLICHVEFLKSNKSIKKFEKRIVEIKKNRI